MHVRSRVLCLPLAVALLTAWALVTRTGVAVAEERRGETAQTEPELQVRLSGHYAFAPATLRAIVRVRPDQDNRLLKVVADSETFLRSSDIELDGASAPRVHTIDWRALPAGTYEISIVVVGTRGPRARITQSVVVVSRGDDPLS